MNNKNKLTSFELSALSRRQSRMRSPLSKLVEEIKVSKLDERILRYLALGLCDVKFYDCDAKKLVDEIEPYKKMYIQIRPIVSTKYYYSHEPTFTPNNEASKMFTSFMMQYYNLTGLFVYDKNYKDSWDSSYSENGKLERFDLSVDEMIKLNPSIDDEDEEHHSHFLSCNTYNTIAFKHNFSKKELLKTILKKSTEIPSEDIEHFCENGDSNSYSFSNNHGRQCLLDRFFLYQMNLTNWHVDKDMKIQNWMLTKESIIQKVKSFNFHNSSYEDIQHHYHFDFSYIVRMDYENFKPSDWMKMFRLNTELPPRLVPESLRRHFTPSMIAELMKLNPLTIYDWGLYEHYDIKNPNHVAVIDIRLIYPLLPLEKQLDPAYYLEIPSTEVNPLVKEQLSQDINVNIDPKEFSKVVRLYELSGDANKVRIINQYHNDISFACSSLFDKDVIDRNIYLISDDAKESIKKHFLNSEDFSTKRIDIDLLPNFISSSMDILKYYSKNKVYEDRFLLSSSTPMDLLPQVKALGSFIEIGENIDNTDLAFDINNSNIHYTTTISTSKKTKQKKRYIKIRGIGSIDNHLKLGDYRHINLGINYEAIDFRLNEKGFNAYPGSKGLSFENETHREEALSYLLKEKKKEWFVLYEKHVNNELEDIMKSWSNLGDGVTANISKEMRRRLKNFNKANLLFSLKEDGLISICLKKDFFVIEYDNLKNLDKCILHNRLTNRLLAKDEPQTKVVKI